MRWLDRLAVRAQELLVSASRRSPLLGSLLYLREVARLVRSGAPVDLRALAGQLPGWLRSQRPGRSPLGDERPWITFGALEFLEPALRPELRAFEFGSGGSTLFFSRRLREGASVDHDRAWVDQVNAALAARRADHWQVSWEPGAPGPTGDPADPDGYASSDPSLAGLRLERYAASIDRFADDHFDLVLLDGRARPSCFEHALPKVAPGGLMVLDNAERAHYRHIHTRMRSLGWQQHSFRGPGPYTFEFWETTAWRRP
jgi:hypothetical protein